MAKPTRPPNTTPFKQPAFYTGSHAIAVESPASLKTGGLTIIGPSIAAFRGEANARLNFEVPGSKKVPVMFRAPKGGSLRNVSVTVYRQLPVAGDVIIRRAPYGSGFDNFEDFICLNEMLQKTPHPAGFDVDFEADEYRFNKGDTLAAQIEVDGAFIDASFTLFLALSLDAE